MGGPAGSAAGGGYVFFIDPGRLDLLLSVILWTQQA